MKKRREFFKCDMEIIVAAIKKVEIILNSSTDEFVEPKNEPLVTEDIKNKSLVEDDTKNEFVTEQDIKNESVIEQDIKNKSLVEDDTKNEFVTKQDIKNESVIKQDIKNKSVIKQDIKIQQSQIPQVEKTEPLQIPEKKSYKKTSKIQKDKIIPISINITNIHKNVATCNQVQDHMLCCDYCHKMFSRKDAVIRHIKENRCKSLRNVDNQKIIEQLYETNQISDLNAKKCAIKSTDLGPETNICQYCGYNFPQKLALTRHLNKNYCRQLKENYNLAKVSDVNPVLIRCLRNNTKKIETLERELAELKEQPRVNNK